MRRFRRRRRRVAALALLPLAALTTANSGALAAETPAKAQIDPSARAVSVGKWVTLRGSFPGAANAPVEIRHRIKGATSWRAAGRTRTNKTGRYRVRIKPRRTGLWRAELGPPPTEPPAPENALDPVAAAASAVDRGTGSEKIVVRSRTVAKVGGRNPLVGESARITGRVIPGGVRRRVVVRVGGDKQATKTNRKGRFAVGWRARRTGSYPVRVRARSNRAALGSADRAGKVTVFRRALASWYGPGLYGNPLACGGTLTQGTIGVAHRTMPCGTKLTLRHGGKSVNVRVIDRGPFVGNREFDLTAATKNALGSPDVGIVLSSK